MAIDYDRMNRVARGQKAALTRAIKPSAYEDCDHCMGTRSEHWEDCDRNDGED